LGGKGGGGFYGEPVVHPELGMKEDKAIKKHEKKKKKKVKRVGRTLFWGKNGRPLDMGRTMKPKKYKGFGKGDNKKGRYTDPIDAGKSGPSRRREEPGSWFAKSWEEKENARGR